MADASFGLANCLYNQGDDEGAILAFNGFIQDYPDDPRVEDAELGVQSCYYRSGKDMEEYLETNPDSPMAADIYWNKGQDAFAAGNFAEAARAFERVTLDYPESESGPGALFYLAESYYRAEDRDQALAGYHNFMTTHPDHDLAELAHLRAATVLFKQERFAESAQGYETLVDNFPRVNTRRCRPTTPRSATRRSRTGTPPSAVTSASSWIIPSTRTPRACGSRWPACTRKSWEITGRRWKPTNTPSKAAMLRWPKCATGRANATKRTAKWKRPWPPTNSRRPQVPAADAFRVASLARLAEIAEERGDNRAAIQYWQSIVNAGGKPEWTQMAQDRLGALQSVGLAGG